MGPDELSGVHERQPERQPQRDGCLPAAYLNAVGKSEKSKFSNNFMVPQTGLEPDPVITSDGKMHISLADAKTLSLLPRMTPQIVNSKLRRMEGLPMTMNLFD
jgi:hypothetical protein